MQYKTSISRKKYTLLLFTVSIALIIFSVSPDLHAQDDGNITKKISMRDLKNQIDELNKKVNELNEKIEKDKGLVLMPDEKIKPQNEVGEAIYQLIERCRYEGRIILTGDSQTYSRDEKLKVLDRIILTLKQLAEGQFEERNYIHTVIERFSKIKGMSQQKKVLTIT